MRSLLYLFFCLIYLSAKTQTYKKDIGVGNKVEIKGGVTNIKKADTVVVEIYMDLKSKLFVRGYSQIKDSLGFYITTVDFINPYSNVYELDLQMLFDKPTIEAGIQNGVGMINKEFTANKDYWVFSGTVRSENGIKAVIKSKEKIIVSMKGIQGIFKPT